MTSRNTILTIPFLVALPALVACAPGGTSTTSYTATVDGIPYAAKRTVYNMGPDTALVYKYEIDGFPPCNGPSQCEEMIRSSDRHKQRLEERRRGQTSGTGEEPDYRDQIGD